MLPSRMKVVSEELVGRCWWWLPLSRRSGNRGKKSFTFTYGFSFSRAKYRRVGNLDLRNGGKLRFSSHFRRTWNLLRCSFYERGYSGAHYLFPLQTCQESSLPL